MSRVHRAVGSWDKRTGKEVANRDDSVRALMKRRVN
jgi:hypothetical protein